MPLAVVLRHVPFRNVTPGKTLNVAVAGPQKRIVLLTVVPVGRHADEPSGDATPERAAARRGTIAAAGSDSD